MSLCSELENINISVDYFNFIKDIFSDYMQYIINYKIIVSEYLKKLTIFQEKYAYKLLGQEKDNIRNKNVQTDHIFSLTSPIPKIIDKQIENLKMSINEFDSQIEKNNKFIKEKEILSSKFQLMFEESRKDLLKKYKEIDKLRDTYNTNMANTEDTINKYLNKKDNNTVTKDKMKNMIASTKKIEKEYRNLINSTKLYEETFDSLYLSSLENFKKLSSDTSNQMKDSIIDFIILLKNNMKIQSLEIDMYLPDLSSLDEIKSIENIIMKSYRKNNKLIHVKPDKYKLKVFKKKNGGEGKTEEIILDTNPIFNFDDGFDEMILISEENIIKTIKIMKENFELFDDNNLDMELEEEKLSCYQLTQKIFNLEKNQLLNEAPSEEEINKLNTLLDKHHNRVVFLQLLSGLRNKLYEIHQQTFDILTKFFNTIINIVQRDKDFYAVENIIILSQTYYMKGEKDDDKLYLHNKIQSNEIFKSKQFWDEFLEFSINKTIIKSVDNDVKTGNILKENKKDSEDKLGNLAFSQIFTHANNMREFGLDKETIQQIVFPKIEKFRIKKELIENIKGIINK